MDLQNVLKFTKFLGQFREIERSISFEHNSRRENDAEHSRQLVMLARYIITTEGLELSLQKVFQYCLIHDIAEIYAGDMEAVNRTPEQQREKEKNEELAVERIHTEHPEANVLWERLETYEKREDEESKFVYALDKMIPVFNLYNDGGYRWKENKVQLDAELCLYKQGKVKVSAEITNLWEQLYPLMKEKESDLFYIKK